MTVLLAFFPLISAIDLEHGLRNEEIKTDTTSSKKAYSMNEARRQPDVDGTSHDNEDGTYRGIENYRGANGAYDNHLDISNEDRTDCISMNVAAGRSALTGGDGCDIKDADTCETFYELKHRGDHRAADDEAFAYNLEGEVHFCKWSTATLQCMAGEMLTVCPEEAPVEVSVKSPQRGESELTDLISGNPTTTEAPTEAPASSGTPENHCGRELETNDCWELSVDICASHWTADGAGSDDNPYNLCGVVDDYCDGIYRYRPTWSACGVSNDGCFSDASGCPVGV